MRLTSRWCVILALLSAIVAGPSETDAACVADIPTNGIEPGLIVHLPPSCTPAEREAHAVHGEAIMVAIAKGRTVDLLGVIVRGDLIFDHLAMQKMTPTQVPAPGRANQGDRGDGNAQRIVRAALSIRDSVVLGAVRHRSADGMLQFEGPVNFNGSRFKEGVDLSRSVFHESVELSEASFEKEAYFLQGQFVRQVSCRETRFGPSTRFHRSVFHGSMNCTGALFDGTAEFLEVQFEQSAVFERSRFGLGTGFSGSRFKSQVSFRDSIFSRETFFAFAVFEGEAVFEGGQFLGAADFSQAEFRQPDDLAKARFDQPPILSQAKRRDPASSAGFFQTGNGQYALTLGILIVAALLVAYAVKFK
ncbi:MAG: pentapeptide repeat-containing protein [Nitrospira sp.]